MLVFRFCSFTLTTPTKAANQSELSAFEKKEKKHKTKPKPKKKKKNYSPFRHFHPHTHSGQKFLPYLQEELEASGRVTLKQERVADLSALKDRGFGVVVNCAGLGSRSLVHDELVRPIRGQVMRVDAPWIKYCVFADDPFG